MTPYLLQLSHITEPQISVFYVLFAYGLFGTILVGVLRASGADRRQTLDYVVLFTWFVGVVGVVFWVVGAVRLPPDSRFYWRVATMISKAGFSDAALDSGLMRGLSNLGVNTFLLFEAAVASILPPRYDILQIMNIFIVCLAIFVQDRIARMMFGAKFSYLIPILFFIYFALYWRCLHNNREPLVLLFLGLWIWGLLRWYGGGPRWALVVAVLAGIMVVMLRAENVVIMMAFVALYALATARSALVLVPRLAVIVVAAGIAVAMAFEITYGDPLRAVNFARTLRMDGGYFLVLPELESYVDVLWQFPISLSFFLVPIKPWEVWIGAEYILDYVHSLTALAILVAQVVGIRHALVHHPRRRILAVLALSLLAMACIYSLPEVSAESAARHSLFWYYGLMFFAALGVERTRVGLARLARAYRRDGRLGPLPAPQRGARGA
ncbi:MAG: hypothetical protein EXQ94_03400 [Alphaproteobacteria bacterium]|nr:hypothetical protein [Alphaproteobacteria bacterium]